MSGVQSTDAREFAPPIWDRGDPIDAEMLRFTIGDDWLQDRRLVSHDIRGSLAHVAGLEKATLVSSEDAAAIRAGLETLLAEHEAGSWTVEEGDEDVHSAVERRLTARIGEPAKRLHTGRSRNDQVAVDLRLWLRAASEAVRSALLDLQEVLLRRIDEDGALALPGYTHLRRAMPSSIADWLGAAHAALEQDLADLEHAAHRWARCPLGSGAGYGIPLPLEREYVADLLGFEGIEDPVTLTQWTRGRAELAYVQALEGIALDVAKLVGDLWLYSSAEFGFVRLPVELTTGSSLMPQKRNPDVLELLRGHARQIGADRQALGDVLRDLPSGYHRDLQLAKPPLFRAHDRMLSLLSMTRRVVLGLAFDEDALRQAGDDPDLHASREALRLAAEGVPFREAYRRVARGTTAGEPDSVET